MFAIVKTMSEAEQLNEYIKNGYYNEVVNANFDKWTNIITVEDGFAVEILDFMQFRSVPEFIVNGVTFVRTINNNVATDVVA